MFVRLARLASASMFAVVVVLSVMITGRAETARPPVADDGVVRVKSSYSFDDTVRRLREDIAAKGTSSSMPSSSRSSPLPPASSCGRRRC